MNTQQLETFIQVAENLNFARAADALNITQSAVSRQIHALEDELGAKLLHRTTRTVTLTPAGVSFLVDAKAITGRLRFAVGKLKHHTDSDIQVLAIGCGNEAHLNFLNDILDRCRREMPAFHPFLRIIPHRSLLNLFYQGEIDVLIGFRSDMPTRKDISFLEFTQIPICCVVSSGHYPAESDAVSIDDLPSENLVACNSFAMPTTVSELQNHVAETLPPNAVYMCDNLQAALSLVRAGYGCSILPEIRSSDSSLTYIPLENTDPIPYGIFYRKSYNSPLLKKFLAIVRECVGDDGR